MSDRKRNIYVVFIFFIVSCFALIPLIYSKTGILGIDSYFQYNRFYESAMQIKEHNFSFLNLYSFQESGRIVNMFYSPMMSYIFGALLLITGTWFKFQLVTFIILFMTAGLTMYFAGLKLGLSTKSAIYSGIFYLSSSAIFTFITSGTFRSFGFAIIPLFVFPIIRLYNGNWSLKPMIWLGILIATLAQIQLISVLLILPALVFPTIHGFFKSDFKAKRIAYLGFGALISVILSLNILVPFLELNSENNIFSPANMNLMNGVFNVIPTSNSDIKANLLSIAIIISFVTLITFWNKIESNSKLISITGLTYIIVGSGLIPWNIIQNHFPNLGHTLQFPVRISFLGIPFVILGVISMYFDINKINAQERAKSAIDLIVGVVSIMALMSMTFSTINSKVKDMKQPKLPISTLIGLDSNYQTLVTPVKYKNLSIPKYGADVEKFLHTKNLDYLIKTVDRTTVDYVPVKEETNKFDKNTSLRYRPDVVLAKNEYQHTIKPGGKLSLTWNSNSDSQKSIPLFAYSRTQVTLNNERISPDKINKTPLGNLIVNQKQGFNEVVIQYAPSQKSILSIWISILGWLLVAFWICINNIKKINIKRPR